MSASNFLRVLPGVAFLLHHTLFPLRSAAQQLDATVWWGTSTSPGRAAVDERFEIEAPANGLVLLRAPFGKTPVRWGPIVVGRDGANEFHWAGDSSSLCVVRQVGQRNYEGTCRQSGQKEWALTMSRNQPPHGLATPASDVDVRILRRAREILSGPSVWNRHDDRYCDAAARQSSWSLFCALYQASFDVSGEYVHLRPVMEEVRAAVDEVASGRPLNQPLKDFNNLESITYTDIASVFDHAQKRLETRAACAWEQASHWSSDKRYAVPFDGRAIPPSNEGRLHWGEGLTYSTQGKTHFLRESLGPMTVSGSAPTEWLAASSALSGREWKQHDHEGLDVTGELPNGNRWRYFSLCGESWRYHDVPADAATFFDRVIDGAYSGSVARTP
jgi:hypothetical protein